MKDSWEPFSAHRWEDFPAYGPEPTKSTGLWKLLDAVLDDAEMVEYSVARTESWGGDWKRSFQEALAFRESVKRFAVLLDASSTTALSSFETAAGRVTGYPYPWGNEPDSSSEAVEAMRLAYETLIEALRAMLGVDLLGQETLRMLGKPRPRRGKPAEADRAALEGPVEQEDWARS